jgi:hypothetical protein
MIVWKESDDKRDDPPGSSSWDEEAWRIHEAEQRRDYGHRNGDYDNKPDYR